EKMAKALNEMPDFDLPKYETATTDDLSLIFHNTEGLIAHIKDVKCNTDLTCDIVCLTETWLRDEKVSGILEIETFNSPHLINRKVLNLSNHEGGIAIYN
ncbi:unnamed protein product, partial [Owenia fusiformis]